MDEKEKNEFLKKEKEVAMEKVASVNMGLQPRYPSPYVSLADSNMPNEMRELFKTCKYFYMFDPIVSGGINALAGFPVTEVILEESNEARIQMSSKNDKNEKSQLYSNQPTQESDQLKIYKRVIFQQLQIHKLLVGIGIDYWLYGNCFVFGEFYDNPATNTREWKHMTRLDPNRILIDVNDATQEVTYRMTIPPKIKKIVKNKKPESEYNKIPEQIKEAARLGKTVILNPNNIFHLSRPTDSSGDTVWGTPIVANVMKLLLYRNILRQAQEAIAREHIVPFRIFYFEQTGSYNAGGNFNGVVDAFKGELMKSVRDPNYKVISPVPVGVLNLGGQGKALMLTAEIEQVQAEILAGMGVPREFIFGGMSWSGSSISLKILENQFITYRLLIQDFLQNFLVKGMARERGEWTSDLDDDKIPNISMSEIKMQDDVQQKQLIISLNQTNKVPDEIVWRVMGFDPDNMRETLKEEKKKQIKLEEELEILKIESQTNIQIAQLKSQMELQKIQAQLQAEFTVSDENKQLQQAQMQQEQEQQMQQQEQVQDGQPQEGEQPQQQVQKQPQQQNAIASHPLLNNLDPGDRDRIIAIVGELNKMEPNKRAVQLAALRKQIPNNYMQIIITMLREKGDQQGAAQESISQLDAQKIALKVMKMSPEQRTQFMEQFVGKDKIAIEQQLSQLENNQPSGEESEQVADMRPMPQQRPPRRK